MKNINLYLDVSSSNTGVVIEDLDNQSLLLTNISLKSLSKPPNMQIVDFQKIKMMVFKEELDRLLSDYQIQSIYMEGIFIQPKFLKSSEILIKFHGFLMGYFMEYPVYYTSPAEIKKHVTGNGNCKKEDIIKKMQEIYNIELKDEDIADALALCYYHNSNKTYKIQTNT